MAEPGIDMEAAHDSGWGNEPCTRLVIHTTECDCVPGAQIGVANYFTSPGSGGSAQYVEGPDGEEHCVPDNVIAWHAPPNPGSIGIEITGRSQPGPNGEPMTDWASDFGRRAIQNAAARGAEVCARLGIPLTRVGPGELLAGAHGICGHVDVSNAFHQTDHTDPGDTFDWGYFMACITGATPATPSEVQRMFIDVLVLPGFTFHADGRLPFYALKPDGSIYAFNGAPFHGALPPGPKGVGVVRNDCIGLTEHPTSKGGYVILCADGATFAFSGTS